VSLLFSSSAFREIKVDSIEINPKIRIVAPHANFIIEALDLLQFSAFTTFSSLSLPALLGSARSKKLYYFFYPYLFIQQK
jgi:hypothetical protein